MKTALITTLFIILTGFAASAGEGGDGSGGENRIADVNASIENYLVGQALRNALVDYLEDFSKNQNGQQVPENDLLAVSTLNRFLEKGDLQKDIRSSKYKLNLRSRCLAETDAAASISTRFGDVGGAICFDLQKISQEYQTLTESQLFLNIASAVLHEHIHHLQKPSKDIKTLKFYERQAYSVSSYFRKTATIGLTPTFKWNYQPSTPPAKTFSVGFVLVSPIGHPCTSQSVENILGSQLAEKIIEKSKVELNKIGAPPLVNYDEASLYNVETFHQHVLNPEMFFLRIKAKLADETPIIIYAHFMTYLIYDSITKNLIGCEARLDTSVTNKIKLTNSDEYALGHIAEFEFTDLAKTAISRKDF